MAMLSHQRRLARIDVTDEAILCMLLVMTLKWDSALIIYDKSYNNKLLKSNVC